MGEWLIKATFKSGALICET